MSELRAVQPSSHESRRVTLRDGSVVDVRPLLPGDRDALEAAIGRLSEYSRYLRFAASKPRVTKRELDFLIDIDHHDREALVAINPDTRRIVAVVRYVQVAGEPGVVEIAAAVGDDWQGRGLGGALLELLTQRAREEGYVVLRASVLAVNGRSIAMLRGAGFRPRPADAGLREYERALAA